MGKGGIPDPLPLQKETLSDKERWQHLADLADFALAMKVTLMNINYQSFNNFMLRIGKSGNMGLTPSLLPCEWWDLTRPGVTSCPIPQSRPWVSHLDVTKHRGDTHPALVQA